MATMQKVTLSLPAVLLEYVEQRRSESGESRSEVVADLCWRGWRQWDEQRRADCSDAAYASFPVSDEEQRWDEAAAGTMAGWETWAGPEANDVVEEERAEVLDHVRRLLTEAGSASLVRELRRLVKEPSVARAAG